LDKKRKIKIVDVGRKSDRIIIVKLLCEEKLLNVISTYESQIRCEEREKEEFWRKMNDVMQRLPGN